MIVLPLRKLARKNRYKHHSFRSEKVKIPTWLAYLRIPSDLGYLNPVEKI
jgi:hypothetical protein